MNRKEQIEYLEILGLNPDEITNKKDVDKAQAELEIATINTITNTPTTTTNDTVCSTTTNSTTTAASELSDQELLDD